MPDAEPATDVVDPAPSEDDRAREERQAVADWRWGRVRLAVAIVLVLVYAGSIALYVRSLESRSVSVSQDGVSGGVVLTFVPRSITPADEVVSGMLLVFPEDQLIDEDGLLTQDLNVTLFPVLGEFVTTMKAGSPPRPISIEIPISGSVENYPFDSYELLLTTAVTTTGPDGSRVPVPVALGLEGDLVGWILRSTDALGLTPQEAAAFARDDGAGAVSISIRRAGSTIAISLLVLGLMVVLAVLGLLVARSVVSRRRRIEATMASWFAAMLFALVPLRGFLPGAPPLGSWIDMLVVFWVELALMGALAVFVGSWLRMGPRPEPRAPEREG